MGNRYHLVRECVQAQKPFAIYNFTNSKQYNQFLYDLDNYGKLSYVLQTITSVDMSNRVRRVFPSVFVTNEGTEMDIPLVGSVPCEQASIAGVPKRVLVTNSLMY
jgi:hypothetical protein